VCNLLLIGKAVNPFRKDGAITLKGCMSEPVGLQTEHSWVHGVGIAL